MQNSTTAQELPQDHPQVSKGRLFSWSLYDLAAQSYSTVIVSFVFAVYLTDKVGENLNSSLSASNWLSLVLAGSGLVIALTAPVTGQRADGQGNKRASLAWWTALTVIGVALMGTVADAPSYFYLGLALLAVTSITFQFAEVSYFAMLSDVSHRGNVGRVSGMAWGLGYVGGIILMLGGYYGLIAGEGEIRGFLNVTTENGWNIRLFTLVCAGWFALFAIPLLAYKSISGAPLAVEKTAQPSVVQSYKDLWADLKTLWSDRPHIAKFLLASAIYRDGLAGFFAFGAILGVSVFALPADDVLIFGIAAQLTSALGAFMGGFVDDKFGPKAVIIGCLGVLCVCAVGMLLGSGPSTFWVCGLVATFFVGPAQSSGRSYLARIVPEGTDGLYFGLYATTGRAVSFLSPALFTVFVWAFNTDRAGIAGLGLVLLLGLLAMLWVPAAKKL